MRRCRSDRGAVLVIVAAFAIVAIAMLAVVIDLGALREERKEVTLSTDAAALAGAALADTEDVDLLAVAAGTLVPCEDVGVWALASNPEGFTNVREAVENYLTRNGQSQYVDCKVARTSFREGYVAVSADEIVDFGAFGGALGLTSGEVADGISVAAIEVNIGGGLRPIGICGGLRSMGGVAGYPVLDLAALYTSGAAGYELDSDGYVTLASTGARTTFTVRMPVDKASGTDCGAGPPAGSGNFGQLDFGGDRSDSCTNVGHFCKDMADGYYGPLDPDTKGNTGNSWSDTATENSVDKLENNQIMFWSPTYSVVANPGNNATVRLQYFVQMQIVNHCFTGACRFDGARWFDFRISRMLPFTAAGPPPTDDASKRAPRLCAVTLDPADIAAGCPQIVVVTSTTPPPSSTTTSTTTTTTTSTTTTSTTSTTIGACTLDGSIGNENVKEATNRGAGTGQTSSPVVFSVKVVNPSACAGITFALLPAAGGPERPFSSIGGPGANRTYKPTLDAGSSPYQKDEVYNLIVRNGSGAVLSSSATLTIT